MAWIHRLSDINKDEKTGLCANCGRVDLFYRKSNGQWICKNKKAEYDKKYPGKKSDFTYFRDGTRRPDADTIAKMIEGQGGVCAICDEPLVAYHVDHCHSTGKVRGVLCPRCNQGLGFFMDDAKRLAKAILYLS